MKTLVKILGLVAGLLLLLAAAGAAWLAFLFDPNDYKPQLAALVESRTGRELRIGGDLHLSWFPWLALEARDVSLGNAPGFGDEPLARVAALDLRIKVLPLLERRLEIGRIHLQGLRLHLARERSGRTNWQDLAQPAPDAPATPPAGGAAGSGLQLAGLAVEGLSIEDARVVYDDAATGNHLVLADVNLSSGPVTGEAPVDIEAAMAVTSRQPPLDGSVRLAATVVADLAGQRLGLRDSTLSYTLAGSGLPDGGLAGEAGFGGQLDLAAGEAALTDLVLKTLGLTAEGAVQVKGLGAAPRYQGRLAVREFSPRQLLAALDMTPPATGDGAVLTQASATLEFQGDGRGIVIQPLAGHLDDTRFDGQLSVSDFAAPAVGFHLALDALDLNRYLPPAAAKAEAAALPALPAVPVDAGSRLRLDGTLQIGRLQIAHLNAQALEVRVRAADGVLQLEPLKAALYQGDLNARLRLEAGGGTLRLAAAETLTGAQLGPALQDLTGSDRLLGSADVEADLRAAGATPEALRRSLDGRLAFVFRDGAINGINIAQLIREAVARFQGRPLPESREPNQTDFTAMQGSATIRQGVLHNDDLAIKSPLLRITGKGRVDLATQAVDYLLTATLVGTLKGQGGRELEDLKGIAIPIRVSGSWEALSYSPDLQALLEATAQARVEEKIDEKKQELQDNVEEKLQESLGDKAGGQLQDRLEEGLRGLFR
ncbi:MAG: AsmA family protein [Pseudomonadota bacterium]|nr:AsmA family protein [Pseudomonadota bacterium]